MEFNTNDVSQASLLISIAAFLVSALGAMYGRRQAHQAFSQRVLSQYEPLRGLMCDVSDLLDNMERLSSVSELEDFRTRFRTSIKRTELFLPPAVYKCIYALQEPFNEALNEKRKFIEHGGGTITPDGVMRPKEKYRELEAFIICLNRSLPRKIWKM